MKIQRPNFKIKINKTWLMLGAAIVLAILTVWLTLEYLTQNEQRLEAEITARSQQSMGATVAVVVPVRSLPAGTLLSESFVASRNVPVDFTYEDTITVEQFDAFKDQTLLRNVERGKPLRKGDMQEVFADFSGTLKDGKRAMTINVDEINSVSHMIEPGNLVDLMLILPSGVEDTAEQTVVPFLDQVKVLATGQKVTHGDADSGDDRRRVSYSNFTLEVTPTEAARLALATELGKVRAVLRNENDKQSVYFDSVNSQNLLEEIRERERQSAISRPRRSGAYVEYFIGGKGNSEPGAPAINVPLMQTPTADAGSATASPPISVPQNLADLVKLSLGNTAAPKSSK